MAEFVLPVAMSSKSDVVRLQRELEAIDDFLRQAKVRKGGQAVQLPKVSQLLQATCEANHYNVLQQADREALVTGLKQVFLTAPTVHISFASAPGPKFLERLTSWFRQEIDPHLLIDVGLQPSIAAGCTLRTTSKYFDFSLRKHLASKQPDLLEKMRSLRA